MNDEKEGKDRQAPPSGARADEGQGSGEPLSEEAQDLIGRRLRETYALRLTEPVPEKLTQLLEALAKKKG